MVPPGGEDWNYGTRGVLLRAIRSHAGSAMMVVLAIFFLLLPVKQVTGSGSLTLPTSIMFLNLTHINRPLSSSPGEKREGRGTGRIHDGSCYMKEDL